MRNTFPVTYYMSGVTIITITHHPNGRSYMSFDISETGKQPIARPARRTYTGIFKAQVVADAITNKRNIKELAAYYGVHPNQIKNWKSTLLKRMEELFEDKRRLRHNKSTKSSKQQSCMEEASESTKSKSSSP